MGGRFAAGERADAQDEFGEVEGLRQVIVGAEREPGDTVCGGAGGGEHKDHCRVCRGGDHLAERVAMDSGEIAIEYDHVVGVQVELGGGFVAVVGDIDRDALVTEPLGDAVGKARHVLDHEHLHAGGPDSGRLLRLGG